VTYFRMLYVDEARTLGKFCVRLTSLQTETEKDSVWGSANNY